ncbi:MAG TPA: hypothetical protein VIJ27_03985 [Mucilaginibacter sp.]
MSTYQFPPIDNPKQFEQLMADLLNEHYHTLSFKCFGKNGHDQKGIDLFSAQKQMVVQCKHKDMSRSAAMIKKELLTDIETILHTLSDRHTPIVYATVVIATTASEHTDYDEYAEELRQAMILPFEVLFWGWETIQQQLSHLPITLTRYYPQFHIADLKVEDKLLSRLAMKKNIERDFADWLNYAPEKRKRRSRMIIHSAADTHYPKHPNEDGPWYWFAAEIARLSTKGLGFYGDNVNLYVNDHYQWTARRPADPEGFMVISASKIDVIDFNDIVSYDLNGDEHYNCPHFYVSFNEQNSPFSEFYYRKLTGEHIGIPLFMDSTTELKNV